MAQLKKEVDEVTSNVEQSEALVNKLENEIIEWNAHKKLCRRDEELAEIDSLLTDFRTDLQHENDEMEKEFNKNQVKIEKDGDKNGNLAAQKEGIINYIDEIQDLTGTVDELKAEKDQCFKEFDADIPRPVKEERVARLNFQDS